MSISTILYATDLSEASRPACAQAVELARQCGATLTILHAFAEPTTVAEAWGVIDPRSDIDTALKYVASDVHDVEIHRLLYVGSPAETIVEYAREHGFDVIVMGTHGRSGVSHLLMGSVAEQVIRQAPCPVMVVPREKPIAKQPAKSGTRRESSRHVIVV